NEGKEMVICTHGKQGATFLDKNGNSIEQPALLHYPMKDANGAGDSFFAGFLYGWMQGVKPAVCMQMGAVCAALCIGSGTLSAENLSKEILLEEMKKNGYWQ